MHLSIHLLLPTRPAVAPCTFAGRQVHQAIVFLGYQKLQKSLVHNVRGRPYTS